MIHFSRLLPGDIDHHYLTILGQLGTFDGMSVSDVQAVYQSIQNEPNQQIWVARESPDSPIVATGTILIEQKLYRNGRRVGHIEDICVDPSMKTRGWGRHIVNHLISVAKSNQCYKVILDCAEDKRGFYQKCGGMQSKNIQMSLYFD